MSDFGDLIGQDAIIKRLEAQLLAGKVSHAYIISGPSGSGKMTLAEGFAESLVNTGKNARHSSIQAKAHSHPDILYVTHEKPRVISVGDIREQINDTIYIKPYSSPYKIYIVDEAHKMNTQAQNALLKTIEEPPAYAVIMLLSENTENFLPTILSRALLVSMLPVADADIEEWLVRRHGMKSDEASALSAFCGGAPGRALELSGDGEFRKMRKDVEEFLSELPRVPEYKISGAARVFDEYKSRAMELLELVLLWYFDVLSYQTWTAAAHGQPSGTKAYGARLRFSARGDDIKNQAGQIKRSSLLKITELVAEQRKRLAANVGYTGSMDCMWIGIRENMK